MEWVNQNLGYMKKQYGNPLLYKQLKKQTNKTKIKQNKTKQQKEFEWRYPTLHGCTMILQAWVIE